MLALPLACGAAASIKNTNNPIEWGRGESRKSMAVKIRLKRTGMKKAPSYRVVVADARSPRDGRIIENIGWYNPRVEPSAINIDKEKALNWLKNGAQPTDSVLSLLQRAGIVERSSQTTAAPDAQ
jgi:small subunit ribosomal protein S16